MMNRWIQNFKQKAYQFRWAVLSGLLVSTSFIPFPTWAVLFCYAPVWLQAVKNDSSPWDSFKQGWTTQFVLSLVGFHWVAYTAHEFGQMPWIVSILALLIFSAIMHIYIAFAMALGSWAKTRWLLTSQQTLFVIAIIHSMLERIWPVIFDWNLGYTLLGSKNPLYHFADLIGFLGLSTLVLLLNAWMALIWLKKEQLKAVSLHLLALFTILAVTIGLGALHGKKWNTFDAQVKATVIQANIGNLEKVYAEKGIGYQTFITQKFLSLTQAAHSKFPDTDIFIWPETAFPDYLDQHFLNRTHTRLLSDGLFAIGKPLITGAYSKDPQTDAKIDRSTYNALFLVDMHGNSVDKPYRKTELLAFGEYLPLSERFPILLKMLPFISNFGRGKGPETMNWSLNDQTIRWGGQICYEGLYPAFSRGLSEKGANILVNVTNDSWFGKTFEPYQHLYLTLARAIEVRRPLIRSTNTGISTAILANGDILHKSPLHEEWSGQFDVKYLKNPPLTFYVVWGHWDWILWLSALLTIIFIGARNARTRRP